MIEGSNSRYNGELADVWSCGVFLYVMLFHSYPFERAQDPKGARGFKIVRPLQLSHAQITFSSAKKYVEADSELVIGNQKFFLTK